MALDTLLKTWEDYESVQVAFRRLKRKSKTKSLADGTYDQYRIWMPRLMDFTRMNPDELIEEGLKDPDVAEDRLSDLYSALSTKKLVYQQPIANNSLRTGIFGHLRGFYTKNRVNTNGWTTPILEIPQVDNTDARYPLFLKNEKTGKLDLNRDLLQKFFRSMMARDEVIALCLMSSGLDSSDILALTIGDIEIQENQDRIFVTTNRRKTSEMAKSFLSTEATQYIRKYIRDFRKNAGEEEQVFVNSKQQQRSHFTKKHGRKPTIDDVLIPVPIVVQDVAVNFRLVQETKLNIKTFRYTQSPLRPKRLRKVFKSACARAGLDLDTIRVFMGQSGQSSKVYLGKSREELETYYEQVEPFLTLYNNQNKDEEIDEMKKLNQDLLKRIQILEERQFDRDFQRKQ